MAQRIGTRIAVVVASIGCADAYILLGSLDEACHHALAALTHARACQYRVLEGRALTVLAGVRLRQGQHDQAQEAAQSALVSHRETGHRLGEARTLDIVGHLARATGDEPAAERLWRVARDLLAGTDAAPPAVLAVPDLR